MLPSVILKVPLVAVETLAGMGYTPDEIKIRVPAAEGARLQRHKRNSFQAWFPLMGPPDSKSFTWGIGTEFGDEKSAEDAALGWLQAQFEAWTARLNSQLGQLAGTV
jgi:hypothetical protein